MSVSRLPTTSPGSRRPAVVAYLIMRVLLERGGALVDALAQLLGDARAGSTSPELRGPRLAALEPVSPHAGAERDHVVRALAAAGELRDQVGHAS